MAVSKYSASKRRGFWSSLGQNMSETMESVADFMEMSAKASRELNDKAPEISDKFGKSIENMMDGFDDTLKHLDEAHRSFIVNDLGYYVDPSDHHALIEAYEAKACREYYVEKAIEEQNCSPKLAEEMRAFIEEVGTNPHYSEAKKRSIIKLASYSRIQNVDQLKKILGEFLK